MAVFLIVVLLLAALFEFLSLRAGAESVDAVFSLSKSRIEIPDTVEIVTKVRNRGRLPISYCLLRVAFPLSAILPERADVSWDPQFLILSDVHRLWGRSAKEHRMSFRMARRGVYSFIGREICRGDFLGLRVESRHFYIRSSLVVYPQRLESAALSEALGSYCGDIIAQRWLLRDPVLTLGVREYTGSEPMHTISWSQTARRGELTVREFDFTRSLNCRILLLVNGLKSDEDALLDRCCGAARTVCETLISLGVEAQLFTNAALAGYPNQRYREVSAALNREEDLLDVLARVTYKSCSTAEYLAAECAAAQTDTAAYVVIAPRTDEQTLGAVRCLDSLPGIGALLVAVDQLEEGSD